MGSRYRVAIAAAALAAWYVLAVQRPGGEVSAKSFDADRLAHLETEMWQAYYDKRNVALFRLLATTVREQYRYPYTKAIRAAYHLAKLGRWRHLT